MSSSADACAGLGTGDVCGTGLICDPAGTCIPACFINGSVVMPGDANPGALCQHCDPAQDTVDWSNDAVGTPCSTGDYCTSAETCDAAAQCTSGSPTCTGPTPICNGASSTCACDSNPDSCAGETNNKKCLFNGTCGCTSSSTDCAASYRCSNNSCQPCNVIFRCGLTCGNCTTRMTLDEKSYWTCSGNTDPVDTACQVATCAAGTAHCGGGNPGLCETDLTSDAQNCGQCGTQCPSGSCVNSQCTCANNAPGQCPSNQSCQSHKCECGTCHPGYTCTSGVCL